MASEQSPQLRVTIEGILNPRSVAVIGASKDPKKRGNIALRNLIEAGYQGKIYPINPSADEVLGYKVYGSVKDVLDEIDLALIVVPASIVPQVVEECVQKGVKGVIVTSSGFKETGKQGAMLEREVVRIAKAGGVRIIGPNCIGIVNVGLNLDATISRTIDPTALKRGGVAFISQSGAFGGAVFTWAQAEGIGFSKFISYGNRCDVDDADLLEYFMDDLDTKVVVIYIEGVDNGRKFIDVSKKVTLKKPVIVVKVGRTKLGSIAAISHTGAIAGSDEIYDAAFKQSGIIRAQDIEEMFDYAAAFECQPFMKGDNVAILSNAGGPAVAAADACVNYGLKIAPLSVETKRRLRSRLSPFASYVNPVDITAMGGPETYGLCLDTLLQDQNVDAVITIVARYSRDVQPAIETAKSVVDRAGVYNKPVLAAWTARGRAEAAKEILRNNGIPVYTIAERAVRALSAMAIYRKYLDKRQDLQP